MKESPFHPSAGHGGWKYTTLQRTVTLPVFCYLSRSDDGALFFLVCLGVCNGNEKGFTRFVEIGRVALINYGPHEGKLAVIIDVVDNNKVCVIFFAV